MLKEQKTVTVMLAMAALFSVGAAVESAVAQKAAPKDRVTLGEPEIKQLLLLMDTDKNGKISRQEFMNFMQAEFDRLDKDKSGELDAKELVQSQLQASKPVVGK